MLPGARDSYINLGRFYDSHRLEKRRAELTELTRRYKNAYSAAYDYLSAAGALNINGARLASEAAIMTAVQNCAALLPPTAPSSGNTRNCFIDTFCCKGKVSLYEAFGDWHVYTINASAADGDAVLRKLGKKLTESAYSITYCYSPLSPELMQHLLVPCQKTIFTLSRMHESTCAAALSQPRPDEKRIEYHTKLLDSASEMLALAKRNHDALEEVYNPCVDFSGIYSEARKHINAFL
ncbi:MAG: hypothetical protein PUB32_06610 [Clostridiales bacterium]|nr:hypothetical protein [Clostridiales bacterium]